MSGAARLRAGRRGCVRGGYERGGYERGVKIRAFNAVLAIYVIYTKYRIEFYIC